MDWEALDRIKDGDATFEVRLRELPEDFTERMQEEYAGYGRDYANGFILDVVEQTEQSALVRVYFDLDTMEPLTKNDIHDDFKEALDAVANGEIQDAKIYLTDVESFVAAYEEERLAKEAQQPYLGEIDEQRIRLGIVSKDNGDLTLVPHRDMASDVSVVAYYVKADGEEILIDYDIASRMCMTAAEVMERAIRNEMDKSYGTDSIDEIIAEKSGLDEEKCVRITNGESESIAGFFTDFSRREEVARQLDGDYYVLPMSEDELLCVAAASMTFEEAARLYQELNSLNLAEQKAIAQHPFLVDAETLKLHNPTEERMQEIVQKAVAKWHM